MQNDVHKPNYIYRQTVPIPEDTPKVRGYDFNQGVDHQALLQSFYNTGFQATSFGLAVNQINLMVRRKGLIWDSSQWLYAIKKTSAVRWLK